MSVTVPNSTTEPQEESSFLSTWSTAYDYATHPSKIIDEVTQQAVDLYDEGVAAAGQIQDALTEKVAEAAQLATHAYRYYSDHSLSQIAHDGIGWAEEQALSLAHKALEIGVEALPDSLAHYLAPQSQPASLPAKAVPSQAAPAKAVADAMPRQAVAVFPPPETTTSSATTVVKNNRQASTKSTKNSHAEKLPGTIVDYSSHASLSPQNPQNNFGATKSGSPIPAISSSTVPTSGVTAPSLAEAVTAAEVAAQSSVSSPAIVVTKDDKVPTDPVVEVLPIKVEVVSTVSLEISDEGSFDVPPSLADFSFLNGGGLNVTDNSGAPLNLAASVSDAMESTLSVSADSSLTTADNNSQALAEQVASRAVSDDHASSNVTRGSRGQIESDTSSVADFSASSHQEISWPAVVVSSLLTPAQVAANVASAQATVAVPKNNFSPRVVVSGDLVSSNANTQAVASTLDIPLNRVADGGDKGSDTNDRGHDRATESIFALADNDLNESPENDILPTLEGEILERPSSESAFV